MRLATRAELTLPDGMDWLMGARSCLVSEAGVFFSLASWGGGKQWGLVSITDGTLRTTTLEDVPAVFAADDPAPVLLDDDTLGLVVDAATLRVYGPDLRLQREIAIVGEDVLEQHAEHGQRPRLTIHASRGTVAGEHVVVLDAPVMTGNPRFLAHLRVREDQASWTQIRTLGPDGFPADRIGGDDLNVLEADWMRVEGCIVGHAAGRGDGLLVCVEGSDASSVNRYGADFFSVVRIAADGSVSAPLHEQSGWKRQPGKHGINGKITSSGRYVVLTPVFASGEWKGKQRLLDLETGELVEPVLPRGATRMRIIDHHGTTFWIHDEAQRVLCAEAVDA